MKESGLIICFVVGFVAFVVGWLKGCEHELSRIRNAFNLRGYSRGEFDDILEKYEQVKKAASFNVRQEKKSGLERQKSDKKSKV